MTVCMLIWDYWPGREGGAQRQCRKLARALAARGVKVEVVTQRPRWAGRRTILDQGIPVVRLGLFAPLANIAHGIRTWKIRWAGPARSGPRPEAPARTWGITTPLWRLARSSFMAAARRYVSGKRREFSLIHVHESNWIAGFASLLGDATGLPVLCKAATLPCLAPMGPDVPRRSSLLRGRPRVHFIALNGGMEAELREAGVDAGRIHRVANGVEIPPEPASPQDREEVLFIANFSQGAQAKAYDVLLRAWGIVRRQERRSGLVMAGGGDPRPWQRLAGELGCADSVAFPGFVNDLDELYRRAAVFVLPSRREGMSNALLEAQSWGIPAVVSDIPGNLAVVRHGENGLVVAVDDAEELAGAILRLLKDPWLRKELGERARQRMIDDHSLAAVSARIQGLYRELTASGR